MLSKRKTKIEIIIEKKDGMLWGIVENKGNFVVTPYGKTKDEVISNLKELIKDYQLNEGKRDKFWSRVDIENMDIEIFYDLQAFFKEFKELKISSLASTASLNPSLLRQYASGSKYPSIDQAKKLEAAVHALGKKLNEVAIYA